MFTQGSLSVRRFHCAPVEGDWRGELLSRLNEHAHRDPLIKREGQCSGWCSPWSFLETSFEDLDRVLFNHYIYGGIRIDTYAVNSALRKERVAQAAKDWCREHNKARCPRMVKADLKEKIIEEMLLSVEPRIRHYDWVWNVVEGWVAFGGTSDTAADTFRKLFNATFGISLDEPSLDERFGAKDIIDGDHDQPLTPEEFLLWLFCESDRGNTPDVRVDNKIVLLDDKNKASITGPDISSLREISVALSRGKKVSSYGLTLENEERTYVLSMRAPGLHFQGRLPACAPPNGDKGSLEAELLYERMYLYEEAHAMLSNLYRSFREARATDEAWAKHLKRREEWLEEMGSRNPEE